MSNESDNQWPDFSEDGKRMWVVNLRLRSAARFEGDKNIHVIASPQSTASVCGLKIRNMKYNSVGEGTYVSGLVFEAAGELVGSRQAASVLANFASSYIQVAALAANAAFSDDFEMIIYAPPTEGLPGRFHTQKSCLPSPPAARLRTMPAEDMMEVMQALQSHRDEERLHRAMAHFRIALNSLQPRFWVLAAEHLFIATENLQRVIFRRLCDEKGLPVNGGSKHALAVESGFHPVGNSNGHLSKFDSFVRLKYVFDEDEECYKGLKFASDHFEHGSEGFGSVQEKANLHTKDAFRYVRHSILRELGVDAASNLFKDKYAYPLAHWHPNFEIWGEYTHPDCDKHLVLDPDSVGKDWPPFNGLNLDGRIADVVDDEDTKKRTITFKVNGNGHSLVEGQTVSTTGSQWVLPSIAQNEVVEDDEETMSLTIETNHD